MPSYTWDRATGIGEVKFTCGYCGVTVGPHVGFRANEKGTTKNARILICPSCTKPTFFGPDNADQTPAERFGREVNGITDEGVKAAYNEARDCTGVKAYTGAALVCRKILMSLSVQHGADAGKKFAFYVDYLDKEGYVPPNGKEWVDRIREGGNEATHELPGTERKQAEQILTFVEMLLRFNYEFPQMLQTKEDE